MEKQKLNEILIRRKGLGLYVVHVQKITDVTWEDLQQLITAGANRSEKMLLLYKGITSGKLSSDYFRGEQLTSSEVDEITRYIAIIKHEKYTRHYDANIFITKNNLWDEYKTIRTLNYHSGGAVVKGIKAEYFKIVCKLSGLREENGAPLEDSVGW